jgi:hypothetical protein
MFRIIEGLPPEGLQELSRFLDRLKLKHPAAQPPKVVALGGLWKDRSFDVTDSDVRALRRRVTAQLLAKT